MVEKLLLHVKMESKLYILNSRMFDNYEVLCFFSIFAIITLQK